MSAALPFPLLDLAVHEDGVLLCAIAKVEHLHDASELARRVSEQAFRCWMCDHCHEAARLSDFIAATPATTPEGVRAKVEHMLRDVEGEEPDFGGVMAATSRRYGTCCGRGGSDDHHHPLCRPGGSCASGVRAWARLRGPVG